METFRKHLVRTLEELNWVQSADKAFVALERVDARKCLLRELSEAGLLSRHGEKLHQTLSDAHAELRISWPRCWSDNLAAWYGNRLFLSFAGNFALSTKFATLVSSALGRDGQKLREWPRLVDLALQSAQRSQHKLLVAPESTLSEIAAAFASQAAIDCVRLEAAESGSLASWLDDCMHDSAENPHSLRQRILISPSLGWPNGLDGPLQDRLATALADTIYALYVRPKGKMERLLRARLEADFFPIGSVFVALPDRAATAKPPKTSQDWLERGAVGWYVPPQLLMPHDDLTHCRYNIAANASIPAATTHTQQLCSKVPRWWRDCEARNPELNVAPDQWRWLVHCTRGSAGPEPEESLTHFWQRAWLDGNLQAAHPMLTLNTILRDRALKGTARITRTSQRSVSFSAVPLLQLVERRRFRSHLSRWDWEPYGFIFCREALYQLGTRPVTYGDESCFATLPPDEQPFFQPLGKNQQEWKLEQEWRLLGDLNLLQLPQEAVTLFVRSRAEATQLSRHSPWPVLWVN